MRRRKQATCSTALVLPIVVRMLDAAADTVLASARWVTTNAAAAIKTTPASGSRSFGILFLR
jgi:hypothetical protein